MLQGVRQKWPHLFMPCPGARMRPIGVQRAQVLSVQVPMNPCDMGSVRRTMTGSKGVLAPPLVSSHVNISKELLRESLDSEL